MSAPDIRRSSLSLLAIVAAGVVATASTVTPADEAAPLLIEWTGSASSASSPATKPCSEKSTGGQGVGIGPKCPVSISLAPTNTLGVAATGVLPGSTAQRAVDVTNDGNVALGGITLAVRSSTSTPLTDGSATGLQLRVDRCSSPWSASVHTNGAPTYSCAAASQVVLAQGATPLSPVELANSPALARGGVDHLRVTLSLPSSAGLATAGHRTVLTYSFQAVQKTGRA